MALVPTVSFLLAHVFFSVPGALNAAFISWSLHGAIFAPWWAQIATRQGPLRVRNYSAAELVPAYRLVGLILAAFASVMTATALLRS